MQSNRRLNIICWAFPSWNGDYLKSTVMLMKELAVDHNILYIDYAFTIKDVLFPGKNKSVVARKILNEKYSLQKIELVNGGSIYLLSLPPMLPINWIKPAGMFDAFQSINANIVLKRIRRSVSKWGYKADVIINAFNPFFGNASMSLFPDTPVIYYCYDNMEATAWAAHHGARLEKKLFQKANATIFTSVALQSLKQTKGNSYVVPNGVDIRNFLQVKTSGVNKGNSPIVGYVGSIDDRLDYDLLKILIEKHPHFEFKFIGRIMGHHASVLEKYPNVVFTGARSPESLPGLMADFSAGIIPFVKNDFTKTIYPMKVNEYLALGIPVVSTDFAQMHGLEAVINVSSSNDQFVNALKAEINSDNEVKKSARIEMAKQNSWEERAKQFSKILFEYAKAS